MKKSNGFLFLGKFFAFLFCVMIGLAACSNGGDSPVTPVTPTTTSYAITIQSSANGTITADKTSAAKEETVTLTVAPNSGYELISLTVSSGNFTLYYEIEGTGATRTFTMPDANVTVKGVFCAVMTLGKWPQTIKADGVTVNESESTINGAFTYYKGSDNEWYVKQSEKACSSEIKYSDGTVVGQGGTSNKYFKVEPIKWRVLSTNYGGKKLLLANNALALCAYYDTKEEDRTGIHPNNYKESRVRAFLNGLSYTKSGTTNSEFNGKGFLQTAFTDSEQSSILTTNVDNSAASTACQGVSPASISACDNTNDKIFALSLNEAADSAYGFSSYNDSTSGNTRIIMASDYAKACGVLCSSNRYGSSWLLRSPVENGANYYGVRICAGSGKISPATLDSDGGKITGIVPSICVNN